MTAPISTRIKTVYRPIAKQIQYFLMRNPIALNKREKELLRSGPRILANSAPKAGTNLLNQYLSMLPSTIGRLTYHIDETLPGLDRQIQTIHPGQVATIHLPWSQDLSDIMRARQYTGFFMVRDPRDIAISNVHYVTRMDVTHPFHGFLNSLSNDDERLLALLSPPEEMKRLMPDVWKNRGLETFMPWIDEPNICVVKFEDLVGPEGGGDKESQIGTALRIARHALVNLSREGAEMYLDDLYGNSKSKTFHKGQIGRWREVFKEEHKDAYKRRSGEFLIKLGYEKDLNW